MSSAERTTSGSSAKAGRRLAVLRTYDGPATERGPAALLVLARVHAKVQSLIARQIKPHGLTMAQFEVLLSLSTGEGISQQELSERLLVTKGNVCVHVQKMEGEGLLRREDDAADQRIHRLYLTARGRSLLAEMKPGHLAFLQTVTGVLAPDEQATLLMTLLRLQTKLDELELLSEA